MNEPIPNSNSNGNEKPNTEEKLQILGTLNLHPNWVPILTEALEIERRGEEKWEREGLTKFSQYLGWEWFEVHTAAQTLHKMVTERVLDITLSTRSGTHFRVRQPDLVKEVLKTLESQEGYVPPSIAPEDLFNNIIGYDNIKQLIRYGIDASKPVHFLLTGLPASAKTMFLMELSKLPESYYILAQSTTQAGLAGVLFSYQPKHLLIDEIDRLDPDQVGVLNSLMATGIISETKYGKTRGMQLSTKVFAAGIRYERLPGDLYTRFTHIKFEPYTEQEFLRIVTSILINDESCPTDTAELIAREVWNRHHNSSDVRTCIQYARLCGGDLSRAREILHILK